MEFTGPIIVLTPGRVGTQTVTSSLIAAGHKAVQVHQIGRALDAVSSRYSDRESHVRTSKVQRGLAVEMAIREAQLLGRRIRVISLIRDPIDRAISMMFAKERPGTLDALCEQRGLDVVENDYVRRFRRKLPHRLDEFKRWYETVLPMATGLALPPYRPGADFAVYDTPQARCLMMPTEKFASLDTALHAFLGVEIALVKRGVSEDANASARMIRTRLERSVPLGVIGLWKLYRHPIMKSVYSAKQRSDFQRRWR